MIKDLQFDDCWKRDDGTVVLYFIASKDELSKYISDRKYDGAVSMEICIELPKNDPSYYNASYTVSPTVAEGDMLSDVDWHEVNFTKQEFYECMSSFAVSQIARRVELFE